MIARALEGAVLADVLVSLRCIPVVAQLFHVADGFAVVFPVGIDFNQYRLYAIGQD